MIDAAIWELAPIAGVTEACAAVGRPRSTHYRWHRNSLPPPGPPCQATPLTQSI